MRWKLGLFAVIFAGLTTAWQLAAKSAEPRARANKNAIASDTSFSTFHFSVQDETDNEQDDAGAGEDPAAGQDAEAEAGDVIDPETPLLVEPGEPDEIFDAALLMMDLGRLNLTKRYLRQLIQAEPDDAALLAIRQEHGPAVFLKLSNLETLHPESLELLDMINQATVRSVSDPALAARLIQELIKDDSSERRAAIRQLRIAGARAIGPIISALGELSRNERDALLDATGELGKEAVAPLIAATDSSQPVIQNFAIDALGLVGTRDTLPYLWYFAASPESAEGTRQSALIAMSRIMRVPMHKASDISLYGVAEGLRDLARSHYREMTLGTVVNQTTTHWRWDEETRTVVSAELPVSTAKMLDGSRFARQALALAPEHTEAQILVLSLALSSDALLAGWGEPLPVGPGTAHNLALSSGPELVSAVLRSAMAEGNAAVAVAALDVLKHIGSRHQLGTHSEGAPSAILSALNYPDPRVQFAAANAVLHLDPMTPFPGASRVVDIFSRALVDNGNSGAVVVDADQERAGKLRAFLAGMNYEAIAVPTGKAGFEAAAERMDIELILLHINTIRWPLGQTLANLRADARTAAIPIIVYGAESYRAKITEQLKAYPNTSFIAESSSLEDFQFQVDPFLASRRTPPLTPEQRQRQREAAVYWLAHIANGHRENVYNLTPALDALYGAVEDPAVTQGVILATGAIPTQGAQQNPAEFALNDRLSTLHREIAALQLVFHIQRFSMTLSDDILKELTELYATVEDQGLKTALTALQGSLNPTPDQVSERLQRFTSSLPIPAAVAPAAAPEETPMPEPME